MTGHLVRVLSRKSICIDPVTGITEQGRRDDTYCVRMCAQQTTVTALSRVYCMCIYRQTYQAIWFDPSRSFPSTNVQRLYKRSGASVLMLYLSSYVHLRIDHTSTALKRSLHPTASYTTEQ